MRIELPTDQEFRVADSQLLNLSQPSSGFAWPRLPLIDGSEIDLSASFDSGSEADRFAAKLFVRSASPGAVSVSTANRAERLTLRYDERQIPWLGLWINGERGPAVVHSRISTWVSNLPHRPAKASQKPSPRAGPSNSNPARSGPGR